MHDEKILQYKNSLKCLKSREMDESTGLLIAGLLQIKSSKELLGYARRWLKLFPQHIDAVKVIANWLRVDRSKESLSLAADCLKSSHNTSSVKLVIRAILENPPRSQNIHDPKMTPELDLYGLLEARLEEDPGNDVWCFLQPLGINNIRIDRLVLRWLELNRLNPDLMPVTIALFTESPEVLNAIFEWIDISGKNSPWLGFTLSNLSVGAAKFDKSLVPKIAEFARRRLAENCDDYLSGMIFATLIRASRTSDDIQNSKAWYEKHRSAESAWSVLAAILRNNIEEKQASDDFAVNEAKIFLKSLSPNQEIPHLIGTLVQAHPDVETIAMAKNVIMKSKLHWILPILLRVAMDDELICKACEDLNAVNGPNIGHEVLQALLEANLEDPRILKSAQKWSAANPRHDKTPAFKSLLAKISVQ